jgi:hypothetical protein
MRITLTAHDGRTQRPAHFSLSDFGSHLTLTVEVAEKSVEVFFTTPEARGLHDAPGCIIRQVDREFPGVYDKEPER